mgnify:CR=1
MSKYKCECGEAREESAGVTIKVIDGEVRQDVMCQCGKYMTLENPKKGVPSFSSNRWGQVR